ncbi:MAG: LysR family transcriptional regulator, partial [Myxococcota bacterium]
EFVTIVDLGSISAAARALEIPRATLSRRLTSLEAELGVRLVHREPRRLVLTQAGEELLESARPLVERTNALWKSVARVDGVPRGTLRVSSPPTLFFELLFVDFALAHPQVELQVVGTPRTIDLVAEGFDVALRFGEEVGPSMVARRLFQHRTSLVASPAYLERHGHPSSLEELSSHRCVLGFDTLPRVRRSFPTRDGGTVEVASAFVSDELTLRLRAALAGAGPALIPDVLTAPDRNAGRLVHVLPDLVGASSGAAVVYPEQNVVTPQLRAFVDFVVEFYGDGSELDAAVLGWIVDGTLTLPGSSSR